VTARNPHQAGTEKHREWELAMQVGDELAVEALPSVPDGNVWDDREPEDDPYDDVPQEQRDQAADVAKTRSELGGDGPDADADEYVRTRFPSLDWEAAFATDFTHIDWLPGKFMERGQQVTLVGDGKVGKSLFALDWAIRCAAGRTFLGDPGRVPLRVLYLDRENSLRDVITRARALGATPDMLGNLIYKQFPNFSGTLDQSDKAASELVALALFHGADIVILDTVSRFIGGKENDSDTWLQLYQKVHEKLKARGVACLRLDHFGKDSEKGSRGSSAKSQDVDGVWELSRNNERRDTADGEESITTTLKLHRTHTRSGLGEGTFTIVRNGVRADGGMWLDGRTRHETGDPAALARAHREVDVIVDELIAAGVPRISGRDSLKMWLKGTGRNSWRNDLMADVVKELKERQSRM